MIAYGKTVATAAGFILGGPVGGVLAYGAAIAAEKIMEPDEEEFIITNGMLAYLFACLGKVAVADGEISEDEEYNLDEILEDYNFDEEAIKLAYHYFDNSIEDSERTIEFYAKKYHEEVKGNYYYLVWLINHLVVLAYADGVLCGSEERIIRQAIKTFKLPDAFYEQTLINAKIKDCLRQNQCRGFGSGFFITSNGYIITNEHVVEDAKHVLIRSADGIFKAEIIKLDKEEDLCLLKIDCVDHPFVSFNSTPASIAQDVFTLGFPDPEELGYSIKLTKGCVSATCGESDDSRFLQIDAPIHPGNSGGPLFCQKSGNLLGVNTAGIDKFQNVNYAIKAERLNHFIEDHPVVLNNIDVSQNGDRIDSNDIYKHAEQCVVQVFPCETDGLAWLKDISFDVKKEALDGSNTHSRSESIIWVTRGGQKYGPYSMDQVSQYIQSGKLSNNDLSWKRGMKEWTNLEQLLAGEI
jgi:uncharacterized tellurite resistance protein B-like protein